MCVCVCIYIHIHKCVYVYIYIYTHICMCVYIYTSDDGLKIGPKLVTLKCNFGLHDRTFLNQKTR